LRVARLLSDLKDLIFPPRCQVCDRFCPSPLCATCAASFERIAAPFCYRCGAPFDPAAKARPACPACSTERTALDAARSFGLHTGALRDAVNALKFGGKTRLADPLAELLSTLVGSHGPQQLPLESITHVLPVPLHPSRRRHRGFDQAELLATPLAQAIDRPVRTDVLMRVRNTAPQTGLGRSERAANVRGAFELRCQLPASAIRALLVDDVYTTGATLGACARALRAANAEAVYAVTVSRAAPAWHPAADLVSDI
jgi:ComF family protein